MRALACTVRRRKRRGKGARTAASRVAEEHHSGVRVSCARSFFSPFFCGCACVMALAGGRVRARAAFSASKGVATRADGRCLRKAVLTPREPLWRCARRAARALPASPTSSYRAAWLAGGAGAHLRAAAAARGRVARRWRHGGGRASQPRAHNARRRVSACRALGAPPAPLPRPAARGAHDAPRRTRCARRTARSAPVAPWPPANAIVREYCLCVCVLSASRACAPAAPRRVRGVHAARCARSRRRRPRDAGASRGAGRCRRRRRRRRRVLRSASAAAACAATGVIKQQRIPHRAVQAAEGQTGRRHDGSAHRQARTEKGNRCAPRTHAARAKGPTARGALLLTALILPRQSRRRGERGGGGGGACVYVSYGTWHWPPQRAVPAARRAHKDGRFAIGRASRDACAALLTHTHASLRSLLTPRAPTPCRLQQPPAQPHKCIHAPSFTHSAGGAAAARSAYAAGCASSHAAAAQRSATFRTSCFAASGARVMGSNSPTFARCSKTAERS
jgi:hypothetical protein